MVSDSSNNELFEKVENLEKGLTWHRDIEKLMWKMQNQLFIILDSLDAMVYVTDIQSHEVLFANHYVEKLFGKIRGKICWQVLQANMTGPCPFCKKRELTSFDGKPKDMILWEVKNTLNNRWYAIRDRAIEWFDGRVVHMQIAVDITYRKESEAVLKTCEEKFRTVADFTYDWEFWINEKGIFNYVSPSCERITGYSVKAFEETPSLLHDIIHPNDMLCFKRHLSEDLNKPEVFHFDFRIRTRQGEERWISHYCQPVYNKDNKLMGRRASNRDITARKKTEEDFVKQSEVIKRFTNSISHDLKNPAIPINDLIKILEEKIKEIEETLAGLEQTKE